MNTKIKVAGLGLVSMIVLSACGGAAAPTASNTPYQANVADAALNLDLRADPVVSREQVKKVAEMNRSPEFKVRGFSVEAHAIEEASMVEAMKPELKDNFVVSHKGQALILSGVAPTRVKIDVLKKMVEEKLVAEGYDLDAAKNAVDTGYWHSLDGESEIENSKRTRAMIAALTLARQQEAARDIVEPYMFSVVPSPKVTDTVVEPNFQTNLVPFPRLKFEVKSYDAATNELASIDLEPTIMDRKASLEEVSIAGAKLWNHDGAEAHFARQAKIEDKVLRENFAVKVEAIAAGGLEAGAMLYELDEANAPLSVLDGISRRLGALEVRYPAIANYFAAGKLGGGVIRVCPPTGCIRQEL